MIATLLLAPMLLTVAGPATAPPPPVDPLTITVETGDADRFAALFERTGGRPTAVQIQSEYLDRGSYGVHVFMAGRIKSAANLAATIAAKPDLYARAIRTCLPVIRQSDAELRATYLALRGLFPDRPLPQIYIVFGADSSGGTAGPGAQVIGLETLCNLATSPETLRALIRDFYAHETVHVFQGETDPVPGVGVLLGSVLIEGAADFIATLVTGRQITPERAAWAAPREAELWRTFATDVVATRGVTWDTLKKGTPAFAALHRWVGNYSDPPPGWPVETGYWIGQRIWQRWYDRQPDKRVAIREMLTIRNPQAVFAGGRYAG